MGKRATSPSTSSSCSWHKRTKTLVVNDEDDHVITESEMEAAQQLMELSDEDNNNNMTTSNMKSKRRRSWDEEEEVEQRVSSDDIIMAKIQEIFGNDVQVFRAKKQRKYRSLVNIYMATRPLYDAGNGRDEQGEGLRRERTQEGVVESINNPI